MGDDNVDNNKADSDHNESITLIAKLGKERIEIKDLHPSTTIGEVKDILAKRTNILPIRQKLIGLNTATKEKMSDQVTLSNLKVKAGGSNNIGNEERKESFKKVITHSFILMGTPEEHIFVDPSEKDDLPDVIDDFDLDFNAGSDEWIEHVTKDMNLKKFTDSTIIHVMNEPRDKKPLMVLDLDHTLLDFSSKRIIETTTNVNSIEETIFRMKRPYMDEFLTRMYVHYDLVVWSQTSWRWLETKLIELGMLTHPGYKFCFVLDKTSMFAINSIKRDGTKIKHHVKPLQIIWSKYPDRWNEHNTVHLDDLSRNFALNLKNGLKVTAYHSKKKSRTNNTGRNDIELVGLGQYLENLATTVSDFSKVDFSIWMDVVSGKKPLCEKDESK